MEVFSVVGKLVTLAVGQVLLALSQPVLYEDTSVLSHRALGGLRVGMPLLSSYTSMQAVFTFLAALSEGLTKLLGNPNG